MHHIAAYLQIGGNASPPAADVTKVVNAGANEDRLEKLISELEGKDINEVRNSCHYFLYDRSLLTLYVLLVVS